MSDKWWKKRHLKGRGYLAVCAWCKQPGGTLRGSFGESGIRLKDKDGFDVYEHEECRKRFNLKLEKMNKEREDVSQGDSRD
jgi:hypothetical protein